MIVTAGDIVMALREGADTPFEINLRVAHRALTRAGDTDLGYEEWLDSMSPAEMKRCRTLVEEELADGGDDDPTDPSSQ